MKREALLRELRALARKLDVHFEIDEGQGKGSHYTVYFGEKKTTIKSGEIKPHQAKLLKKQLGLL